MQTLIFRGCIAMALSLLVAGCDKPVEEPIPATEQPAAPVVSDATGVVDADVLEGTNGLLTASPGTATCTGTDVTFSWDVAALPEVANIDVWVGDAEGAVLFASGGPTGTQASGPWVTPGTTFVMRDQADQREIDRISIGGDSCPDPEPDAGAEADA